jgi:hypothetical protein
VRIDCEMQARLWMAKHATLYVHLEGAKRWSHAEERRAWGHPRMESGHASRQADYLTRFERPASAARRFIEEGMRGMNALLTCPPAAKVTPVRRDGFMTMPLLPHAR